MAAFFVVPTAIAGSSGDRAGSTKVTFRYTAHLLNARTVTVQGKRLAAGDCQYSGSASLAPGETALEQDEIAEDPATCRMTLVQGRPATLPPTANPNGTSTRSGHAVASPAPVGARSLARVSATHSAGYSKTRFEDPVGIDVNSVKNSVDWVWNGSTVSNGSCSYNYGWLSIDGWGLKDNNWFCRYDGSPLQLHSSSYVHYKNGIFCIGFDTDTYYNRNNAYGRRNGYLVGTWNTSKSGPCAGLLSVHNQLVRTLN